MGSLCLEASTSSKVPRPLIRRIARKFAKRVLQASASEATDALLGVFDLLRDQVSHLLPLDCENSGYGGGCTFWSEAGTLPMASFIK